MAKKYYRVKKENFLWIVGAILEQDGEHYRPLEGTELWDVSEHNGAEWISDRIIENSTDYFEQVFPVHLLKNTVFKLKEEARLMLSDSFK
jgi:hypothetical protein